MKELKVTPIRNGTVIDHIDGGMAITVLKILGLPRKGSTSTVTAAMNVPSRHGRKDVLKIEDRELEPGEVNKIALIAPHASINIIREYEVAKKERVELPDKVKGLVRCPNPNCVTNHEPIRSQFIVTHRDPVRLQCAYCDREIADVAEHIL